MGQQAVSLSSTNGEWEEGSCGRTVEAVNSIYDRDSRVSMLRFLRHSLLALCGRADLPNFDGYGSRNPSQNRLEDAKQSVD